MTSSTATSTSWSKYFNVASTDAFILRASDGVLLAVPTYLLQAASPVFRDLLSVPQPPRDEPHESHVGQNAPGVLPEVQLTDIRGADLELVLRLADTELVTDARTELRQQYGPGSTFWRSKNPKKTPEIVQRYLRMIDLIRIVDKYQFSALVRGALLEPLFVTLEPTLPGARRHFLGTHYRHYFLGTLAVGLAIEDTPLVAASLRAWADDETVIPAERQADWTRWLRENGPVPMHNGGLVRWEPGMTSIRHVAPPVLDWDDEPAPDGRWDPKDDSPVEVIRKFCPVHVSDLDPAFWEVIPRDLMILLLKEETKVVHSREYSWRESANGPFEAQWRKLASFRG